MTSLTAPNYIYLNPFDCVVGKCDACVARNTPRFHFKIAGANFFRFDISNIGQCRRRKKNGQVYEVFHSVKMWCKLLDKD